MKTHSNRLEANVKWGKITSVCTRCRAQPFKVHSNVTAGKVFLSQSFRVMAPKILYSLLCCTFYFHSLILFILFFRDLYSEIYPAWETEPRSHRFTALLFHWFFLVEAESITHCHCFNASQTDTPYFIMKSLTLVMEKSIIKSPLNVFINFICIKY